MAKLKVNGVTDTSGNQYGFRNGQIIQVRNYMYTDIYEDTSTDERDLPGILGNGLAGIKTHSNRNHIQFEATIHAGQNDTWRCTGYRVYWRVGQSGSWNALNSANFTSTTYVAGTSGHSRATSTIAQFDPVAGSSASVGDNVYFKISFEGHNDGNGLHINKNMSTNSTAQENAYSFASTMTLSELWRDS